MLLNRRHFLATATATATATVTATATALTLPGLAWAREKERVSMGANAEPQSADNVIELRQYTLRGGQRDTLIEIFEQKFIEPQNALGAHVVGTFRDLDDPDRFVWIRGFRDMATRERALAAFYGGPSWHANASAANATMVDSDNVLLLQPAGPGQGFPPQSSAGAATSHVIGATIYYLGAVNSGEFQRFFSAALLPRLAAAHVHPLACLVTEEAPNNFPGLPVREHERVFVWFARWPDAEAEKTFAAEWSAISGWRNSAPEAVLPALVRKPERLRLAPTPRSALR